MNKTVNVNLGGINFFIDEEAYFKLKTYLEAVRTSLAHSEGKDEIMRDIEARIAELFLKKRYREDAVVQMAQVDEVIAIMGQPEDFNLENEHENGDHSASSSDTFEIPKRKLYRDMDHSLVGGICAGLSHYFDIQTVWVRLLFVILLLVSFFSVLIVYFIFWIIIPEARTTAEKLEMFGEPVTINNIRENVKKGFDSFSNSVKNGPSQNIQSAFQKVTGVLGHILTAVVKIIGVLLLLIGISGFISILFANLSLTVFQLSNSPWIDYVEMANIGVPLWLAGIILIVLLGVPCIFMALLGIKIMAPHLKVWRVPVNASLIGLWVLSLFVAMFLGIRQASVRGFEGEIATDKVFAISTKDSLQIKMLSDQNFNSRPKRDHGVKLKTDSTGQKLIYSQDIDLDIQPTKERQVKIRIYKSADGSSHSNAENTAKAISYPVDIKHNTLLLGAYFTTLAEHKFNNQEVNVVLSIPEDLVFSLQPNTASYLDGQILGRGETGHFLKFKNGILNCLDCPESTPNKPAKERPQHNTDEWYTPQKDSI